MEGGQLIEGSASDCTFCEIVSGKRPAYRVLEAATCVAFLDHRPLLPGHCLLVPRLHVETLTELPAELDGQFFWNIRLLAQAVEAAMEADGSFVAINVKVSQTVPHLHAHVLPRWHQDGLFSTETLSGRRPYDDESSMQAVQQRIRAAVQQLATASATAGHAGG